MWIEIKRSFLADSYFYKLTCSAVRLIPVHMTVVLEGLIILVQLKWSSDLDNSGGEGLPRAASLHSLTYIS